MIFYKPQTGHKTRTGHYNLLVSWRKKLRSMTEDSTSLDWKVNNFNAVDRSPSIYSQTSICRAVLFTEANSLSPKYWFHV